VTFIGKSTVLRSLALKIEPLHPRDSGDTAYARFEASPDCALLAVVDDDDRPIGLVERNTFLMQFASHYGRAVFGARSITLIMDRHPIVVDAEIPAGDFAEDALNQFSDRLLKGFIVTEEDRYLGVGAVIDLLRSAVRERARSAQRLERLANQDTLTGLASRAHMHDRLHAMLRDSKSEIALLAIDMDRFKTVNDTLGHDAGDRVLQEMAKRLRAVLRPEDLAARLGGDEFAVAIACDPGACRQSADRLAEQVADRIIERMRQPFSIDGKLLFLGSSLGIASYPHGAANVAELMKHADIALYRAKADGKGVWRRYSPAMREGMEQRCALEADLRLAIERGELEVYLQPILALATDRIVGHEALMRWRHPVHGLIPPALFIPIAEDIGLMVTLGQWIFRQACQIAQRLPADQTIAVNISSTQIRLPGLVAQVAQAMAQSDVAPVRIELEITESVLIGDEDAALANIRQLRNLGVRIALDDFGTGYASFAYLQRFPFDIIKIDQTFTAGLPGRASSRAIVSAIAVLAETLGLRVTAEGVETQAQLDAVRALGCHQAQGFLIGHPEPVTPEGDASQGCKAA